MRNTQKNKIVMFQAVSTVCEMHQTSWENNLGFSEAYVSFSNKLNLLSSLSDEQLNSSKGATATKTQLKMNLIDKAMIFSNVLGAHAMKVNNTELLERNIYARSEWKRGSGLVFIGRLKHVFQDAQEFAAGIGEFGIVPSAIQEFGDLISEFESANKKPRYLINDHKTVTQKIKSLIQEIDQILVGQMDRVLVVFESSAPDFVKTFQNARTIIDLKGKRNKSQASDEPDSEIPNDSDHEN